MFQDVFVFHDREVQLDLNEIRLMDVPRHVPTKNQSSFPHPESDVKFHSADPVDISYFSRTFPVLITPRSCQLKMSLKAGQLTKNVASKLQRQR